MFRKTLIAATAIMATISTASVYADVINNKDFGGGTITFHGSVTESPCSIAPGDEKLDINLGQVSKSMLSAVDKGSTPVDIKIHLNSCQFEASGTGAPTPDYGKFSKVDVEFANYNSSDVAKGLLHNDGDATNVDVQLLDGLGQPVKLDRVTTSATAQQLTGAAGEISLKARMLASGVATSGSVNATVNYKLKYF
ncbi:fimbrial protein StdA [Salmonella enterica subsp. diarizonae]|nr:fimbrial protein StdA [Salmonella enterica]ECJ4484560.1 fimbrial protein StdA [Salmonella enterica subsp. diarizonae]EEB3782330.1 fimbrial protein [Salmonella enterica subsp. enterica serovar Java]EDV3180402.1 fimbrial protein [Salmonella enterica subsp. diarizonae]EIU5649595.1 fimbrial protein [Salmonella enterica]